MTLVLGPMPENVRMIVRRLIAASQLGPPEKHDRLVGYLFLDGGPSYCSYLAADGEVWMYDLSNEAVNRVEDGPRKVGIVAIAAERIPGLAQWLPRRPAGAEDCAACQGSGWLPPPHPRVQCPECSGMGWSSG